jgi:hypothetical protein
MRTENVNMLKVVTLLRKMYYEASRRDFKDMRRIRDCVFWLLVKYNINEDLIYLDEDVFQEYSIPVIENYFNNRNK